MKDSLSSYSYESIPVPGALILGSIGIVLCQACFEGCHSALDAESSTIEKSGFPLEFIPHFDAGRE